MIAAFGDLVMTKDFTARVFQSTNGCIQVLDDAGHIRQAHATDILLVIPFDLAVSIRETPEDRLPLWATETAAEWSIAGTSVSLSIHNDLATITILEPPVGFADRPITLLRELDPYLEVERGSLAIRLTSIIDLMTTTVYLSYM